MANEINEDLCRLCSSNEGIKMNIFEPEKNFIAKINFVLSIVIAKHDHLPKMLCHKCVFKVEEYCEFRQLCLSTDKFFRSKLPWPNESSEQETLLFQTCPVTLARGGAEKNNSATLVMETDRE